MRKDKYLPETLNQINRTIFLPDLIQKYTRLNKRNVGLCPFHQEKHPSFTVSAKKGLWYCFGCGKGGNAFNFIMEAEKIPFTDAVKLLAFEAGIRLPQGESTKKKATKSWEEKDKKIKKLNHLEAAFKDYENEIYSYLRFQRKYLPPKLERIAKDYQEELLIDYNFDILDNIAEEREEIFEERRARVRHE